MVQHELEASKKWGYGKPQYRVNPEDTVVFYPNQVESFSVMVRRVGNEATNRLRKVLERPERCRLLCPAHLERAKNGWTKRREELRRLDSDIGYDTPAHDTADEVGFGRHAAPEWIAQRKAYRAEWLAEDGDPPPYDGGGWVRL